MNASTAIFADDDDRFFAVVAKELSIGKKDDTLWTKAFALEHGDNTKAKAHYIRLRVEKLKQLAKLTDDKTNAKSLNSDEPLAPRTVKPITIPDLEDVSGKSRVRPWVRYWARMLDVYSFVLVGGAILAFSAPQFLARQNEYAAGMLLVFMWVFVEALLLTTFQTTPGKWLLKTKIALASGSPISLSQALTRSLKVWWRGFGTGFPVAAMITMIVAHGRLTRNGIASWDKDDEFSVTHNTIGVPRILAAIAVSIVFLIVVAIGNDIRKPQSAGTPWEDYAVAPTKEVKSIPAAAKSPPSVQNANPQSATNTQAAQVQFWRAVDAAVPDFESINKDPRWIKYLDEFIPGTGMTRHAAAEWAIATNDSTKLISVLQDWKRSVSTTPVQVIQKADARTNTSTRASPKAIEGTKEADQYLNLLRGNYSADSKKCIVKQVMSDEETARCQKP